MEIKEIIMESLHFPLDNIQSLIVYLILGFVLGIIGIFTGAFGMLGMSESSGAGIVIALIGIILCLIIYFVINGYELDIIKSGINRSSEAPSIDITRQSLNGVKLFVVQLVYFIIPILITLVCSLIFNNWITWIIAFIVFILFAFVETMGECRLAKTEDLNYALKVSEAIEDIKSIGVPKVVMTIVLIGLIVAVVTYIISTVFGLISQDLASIINALLSVYFIFFENRATGLLYSDLY